MKRHAIVLITALMAAAPLFAASRAPRVLTRPQDKNPDTAVTGCVIQGSSPSVFLLDNARVNAQEKSEKGKTYLLVGPVGDTELARHVNHEVLVIGAAESKAVAPPPPGQQTQEKDLPKLEAKSVTMVSDTCTSAVR